MQADDRYEHREEGERPVIASHIGADRHDAESEEEPGGGVVRTLPEDQGADAEDQ